jgi:hypothetical protein
MTLTTNIELYSRNNKKTTLEVEINWDTNHREIEEIISTFIHTFVDGKLTASVDVSELLDYVDGLDELMDKIDWQDIAYHEKEMNDICF